MKRSTSLQELRDASSEDSSGMRRPRSHQDLQSLVRQSGSNSGSNTPMGGHVKVPILSEKELRDHFNMPLNEVAKKFGMCTTALKKLCRKYGVMQWPHRKLRSLEKKIASLRAEQRYTTDGHGNLDEEIRKYEAQREALVTGNGDPGDMGDDRAWSPGMPGSPGEEEFENYGGYGGGTWKRPPASDTWANQGNNGGDGNKLLDKQNHLQKLEDENSNLRALSRSLMKEREELVNNLNQTNTEMDKLRRLCQSLTTQLSMISGGEVIGDAPGARTHIKTEQVFETHAGQEGNMMPGQTHAPGGDQYVQQSWNTADKVSMLMDQSPQMNSVNWPQQAHTNLDSVPPMVGAHGQMHTPVSGADESIAALSWMAPDFDLDELL